jgi:hypothetical protein
MLKEKMHNATSEVERENYRRVIEQLERWFYVGSRVS